MPSSEIPFARRLIRWQRTAGRHDLPWQNTRDPYRIWLSEIMLQQTQVAAVIPYYARFLDRFPDLAALAAAPLDAVLAAWAGLGYYARARHLHACAQAVCAQHDGAFPRDPETLATLPGIGRSTAAAIAAFAFGARAAILDGNVKRVLTRCFGIDGFPGNAAVERTLWQLAESLLPAQDIEAYTQGLMDLGATLCTRSKPDCAACPLHDPCVARRSGRQAELPTPRPTKAIPERVAQVLVLDAGERFLLERRPPAGIWGGLLSLPEIAHVDAEAFAERHALCLLETQPLLPVRHVFTHFRLTLQPLRCRVAVGETHRVAEGAWTWVTADRLGDAALPAPIYRLLASLNQPTR